MKNFVLFVFSDSWWMFCVCVLVSRWVSIDWFSFCLCSVGLVCIDFSFLCLFFIVVRVLVVMGVFLMDLMNRCIFGVSRCLMFRV